MSFFCSLSRIVVSIAFVAAAGAPALAQDTPDQITDDASGSGCISVAPALNAAGNAGAWQSDCDPDGTNADGSLEIFRGAEGTTPVQLTSGTGCTSSDPVISANGERIAFVSSCDLTGGNADGNAEIFLWKIGSPATITQLTQSIQCDNLSPSINGPGTFIAFDSTCNISGTNNDGRGSEIFRVSASGVLKQLTVDPNGGLCDSTSPSIDDAGTLIAFDSDCDLVGDNEDLATEIYTVNASQVVRQRTFAGDDSCSSVRPSMDGDGSIIGFHSDCDFTGQNGDRSDEIFTITVAQSPDLEQVTDADADDACASSDPQMSSSGLAMSFTSFCRLNTFNGDFSLEAFQVGVGKAAGGIMAVSGGSGCSSIAGGIEASGTFVAFDSDCDPAGMNADRSVEIFVAPACTCGAPATRKAVPMASDALFALRAAVGSSTCALCECDTNDDGQIVTSDSLRILKNAVGQNVVLDCPVP